MENYYELFGIPREADKGGIRKRIHQELRKWSNRTNAPQMERRQEAERMVQLLEEAEEILLDPDKRAAYDRQLTAASRLQTSVRREQAAAFDVTRTGTGTVTPVETIISRGTELLEQNRVADTIVLARQANPDAWALLAHAKLEWGEPEQAVEAFRRAIELKPNDGRYYYGLGQTYEQLNRWEEAVTQYRRTCKTDPDNHQYRVALGMALIRAERFDDGVALLEQCAQAEPDNPVYQESLAIGYQAKAYYSSTKVPAGHPMMAEGRYPTTYQQYRTAVRYLSKALALRFDNPQLRQTLRETLKKVEKEGARLFTGSKLSIGIVWALRSTACLSTPPSAHACFSFFYRLCKSPQR
ncbi:tetratricopeptide repeat protein [Polycladomyces subterraneus]|uniref:Tetratricopeptide repeat protein n=1 Tax=Polycladomyces subterraneus TaxID=1016997 RepID=A0ABT8IL99_9BACL|nr:tetratricopeptide repeat protein [Polycladomyces subterraneus]MDN4593516.1 tetratricopeptide repeat protein [Polycladomyces subterraneus]